ncbi:UNVERIFIED_CONTAM: hypothetical protein HDU68_002794 [Siphonaria sp. JEL0065]|nr:hypothetical protein HDU68_002794 [Siphonaria sp. JEL0065]
MPVICNTIKRKVSFGGVSQISYTFGSEEYDRRCISVDPLTGRDLAALHLFRLSLPTNLPSKVVVRPTRPPVPRCSVQMSLNRQAADMVASPTTQTLFDFQFGRGSDDQLKEDKKVDWITSIAQAARLNSSIAPTSDASSFDSSFNSVWERVDQCCNQVLRCI